MSLPAVAAVADRAITQRFPRAAALLLRCPINLPERTFSEAAEAAAEAAPELGIAGPAAAEIDLLHGDVGAAGSEGGTPPMQLGAGGSVFTGMVTGAIQTMMAPELRALEQRAGGVVSIASQVAIFSFGAFLAGGPCRGMSQALNGVMQYVPFLSGDGMLARSVQLMVGARVGQLLGNAFRTNNEAAAEVEVPAGASQSYQSTQVPTTIYCSDMCVICHKDFGSGDSIFALNCGHACICQEDECVRSWESMIDRSCPVCRHPNARVWLNVVG